MKPLLACLCIFVLPAAAQQTTPAAPPGDEAAAAISQLRDGLITSFKAGDVDKLLTYVDPDIVATWQNGEVVRGPEGIRAFYNRMMKGDKPVVREIQSDPKVLGRQLHGDVAVSWGKLHDHFVLTDGSDLPFNSVFTATVAKRGDRWLVTAFHASVNVFENPVLGYAVKKSAIWTGVIVGVIGVIVGYIIARVTNRRRVAA